jgi:hypothetical protein
MTASPTDYDDLADIVFDAVRNGPSKYTQAYPPSSCLRANPLYRPLAM